MIKTRKVIVTSEVETDGTTEDLRKYYGRLSGPYTAWHFRVHQVQVNVVQAEKPKRIVKRYKVK